MIRIGDMTNKELEMLLDKRYLMKTKLYGNNRFKLNTYVCRVEVRC